MTHADNDDDPIFMDDGSPDLDSDYWRREFESAQVLEPWMSELLSAEPLTDDALEDSLKAVGLRNEKQKLKNRKQNTKLRKMIAGWSVGFVALQLVAANLFFGFYLWMNRDEPNPSVMIAWLSASVVEVIAILSIVANSLFPRKDSRYRLGKGSNLTETVSVSNAD